MTCRRPQPARLGPLWFEILGGARYPPGQSDAPRAGVDADPAPAISDGPEHVIPTRQSNLHWEVQVDASTPCVDLQLCAHTLGYPHRDGAGSGVDHQILDVLHQLHPHASAPGVEIDVLGSHPVQLDAPGSGVHPNRGSRQVRAGDAAGSRIDVDLATPHVLHLYSPGSGVYKNVTIYPEDGHIA